MNFLKYITLSLLVFSIISCENFFETQVELPTPEHTPIMAISCFMNAGEDSVLAQVNRTFGLFEEIDSAAAEQVLGASIEMYRDGNLLYTLSPSSSVSSLPYAYYDPTGTALTEEGATYELRVSHPDYPDAKATQTQPVAIPLTSATFRERESEFSDEENQLKLTFDDPAGEKNYYEVFASRQYTVYLTEEGERTDSVRTSSQVYFGGDDTETNNSEFNYTNGSILLPDDVFDGQTFTFNVDFFDRLFFNKQELFPDTEIEEGIFFGFEQLDSKGDTITVHWRTVTEEYYLYTTSLRRNRQARYDPFTEPIGVFSNFDEAIGAFCLRSELVYEIE